MPEVKQQVNTYMINFLCDDCQKGYMMFTGNRRPVAIQVREKSVNGTKSYLIHKCSSCGKIKEFDNKKYPSKMYETIQNN